MLCFTVFSSMDLLIRYLKKFLVELGGGQMGKRVRTQIGGSVGSVHVRAIGRRGLNFGVINERPQGLLYPTFMITLIDFFYEQTS